AQTCEEDGELRAPHQFAPALEFGRRFEADGDVVDRPQLRVQHYDARHAFRADRVIEIELCDGFQGRAAAPGTKPLVREQGQSRAEMLEDGLAEVEHVRVEGEGFTPRDRQPVEMRDPQDEGARPVGQAARSWTQGGAGLEEARVYSLRNRLMQYISECPAHRIGGLPSGQEYRVEGPEVKTISMEFEGGRYR